MTGRRMPSKRLSLAEKQLMIYEDVRRCGKVNIVNDPDVKLLILIVLGAGLAGALWYFWDDIWPPADNVPVFMQPEPDDEDAHAPRKPMHPMEPLRSPGHTDRELVPLPPLDESDSYFLLALRDIFGAEFGRLLVSEALIDKFVATVDNLSRGDVSEKIRPVGRLPGVFGVNVDNSSGPVYLDPDNYDRYDVLVNLIVRADLDDAVAMYRRFYPLFQESYERLGYPNAYFNDRVVEIIDHLLVTPQPAKPLRLVRPHVLYEFADPQLETLSSGQKLLLRMGGKHAARIKGVLLNLRALVAESPA